VQGRGEEGGESFAAFRGNGKEGKWERKEEREEEEKRKREGRRQGFIYTPLGGYTPPL